MPNNNNEDVKWLYDKLKSKGYDIGSEQDFSSSLQNEADRKWYYDKAKGMGLDMGSMDDFNSIYAPKSAEKPAPAQPQVAQPQPQAAVEQPDTASAQPQQAPQAPPAQPKMSDVESMQFFMNAGNMAMSALGKTNATIANVQRMGLQNTQKGREQLRANEQVTKQLGGQTQLLGTVKPEQGKSAGGNGEAKTPVYEGPKPYGVTYKNGKAVTQWLMADGTVTDNPIEAEQVAYGARVARNARGFQEKLQREYDDAIEAAWAEAQAEDAKSADELRERTRNNAKGINGDDFAAFGAGGSNDYLAQLDAAVKHHKNFDLDKMSEKILSKLPEEYKQNALEGAKSYYAQHPDELKGRSVEQAAQDNLKGTVYASIFDKAKSANAPQSTLDFLMKKIADQPMISSGAAINLAASGLTDNYDLSLAEMQAQQEYGSEHRVADIAGTVIGMAIDPTTYIAGGVGSVAGKGAMNLGSRLMLKGATGEVASRYAAGKLAGRVLQGVAAGSANFGTFNTIKGIEGQLRANNIGDFSVGDLLSETGHGLLLGAATGTLSPIIGNYADKAVKATSSTAGKVGMRAGELAVSTVAEGTIFSIPEWISGERDAMDVWEDNMAMMLGFKASHAIKSVPHVLDALKTDGKRYGLSFKEKLSKQMDASPADAGFTKEEMAELRDKGYVDLGMLFADASNHKSAKKNAGPGNREVGFRLDDTDTYENLTPDTFDGYEAMKRLMSDKSVSEATRAKAYFILTGHRVPMSTVVGYTMDTAADGSVVINSVAQDGGVITTRRFANEKASEQERNNIMRQAELNTVSVGEKAKEAASNMLVLETAIKEVAPEGEAELVLRNYKMVKDGELTDEYYVNQAKEIDAAIERNKAVADVNRPEAIRARLKEETGIDVDDVLNTEPTKRTEAQQKVVQDYVRELFPEEKRTEEGQTVDEQTDAEYRLRIEERQQAYEQGREAYNVAEQEMDSAEADAIVIRMQEAREEIDRVFGDMSEEVTAAMDEDPLGSLNRYGGTSAEETEAMLYYINSKAAVEGLTYAANQSTEGKLAEAQHMVEQRMNKQSGMIHPATLKVDDRQVYIISGEVNMFPDGTAVDVANSSESIIIADAESGEVRFISPDMIERTFDAIAAAEEFQKAKELIMAEQQAIVNIEPEVAQEQAEAPAEEPTAEGALDPQKLHDAVYGNGQTPGQVSAHDLPPFSTLDHDKINADLYGANGGMEIGNPSATPSTQLTPNLHLDEGKINNEVYGNDVVRGAMTAGMEMEQQGVQAREAQAEAERKAEQERLEATALYHIPTDEQGMPIFTADNVDAETGYDGLVEFMEDEEVAQQYAEGMVSDAEKKLKNLAKKQVTFSNNPAAYKQAMLESKAKKALAQTNLDKWKEIASVSKKRKEQEQIRLNNERAEALRQEHDEDVAKLAEQKRIEAEKKAEQEAVGVHAVNPKIKEKWDKAEKVVGAADVRILPDGTRLEGHYVLTEAGATTPSHDINNAFKPTEGFPVDEKGNSVNDRDYERDMDAQEIVRTIANKYDGQALQNVPTVSPQGVVYDGANRTMSREMAAKNGTDGAYISDLTAFPHKFGLTPEQVASFKHPHVNFVLDKELPYDAATFARFNAQEKKQQSKPEAAVKLGKVVSDETFNRIAGLLAQYDKPSDFYANQKDASGALNELMKAGVINDKDLPGLRTNNTLSDTGKELLENTLIGKVFQTNPDAVRQIIAIPSLKQSIVMGLSEIAHNRTLAEKGYSLSDELGNAVDLVSRAKATDPEIFKEGMPVSPFGRQQGLFDDEFGDSRVTDATTLLLADILNSGKPSDLRKVLAAYNKEGAEAAAGQVDMFSGEVADKEQLLSEINQHFINATPKEQQAVVNAAIADRKARAAEQSERGDAVEQTVSAEEGSGQPAPAVDQKSEIQAQREAVNTQPTEAQKKAGNYKMGHVKVDGHEVTLENPKGSVRSGKDADGKEWSITMNYDYGYIKGTKGVDGDHIDVYLSETPESGNVYVVDQIDQKTGNFDEHKVMYGFKSKEEAVDAYLSQYEKGWEVGTVTEVSREDFKKWIDSSHRKTKPFSEYASVKKAEADNVASNVASSIDKLIEKYYDYENGEMSDDEAEKHTEKVAGEILQSLRDLDRQQLDEVIDNVYDWVHEHDGFTHGKTSQAVDEIVRDIISQGLNKQQQKVVKTLLSFDPYKSSEKQMRLSKKVQDLMDGMSDKEIDDLSKVTSDYLVNSEAERRAAFREINATFDEAYKERGELKSSPYKPKKMDLHKYYDHSDKNKDYYTYNRGVYHNPAGYAVSSDGRNLLVSKKDFDKTNVGKTVDKDGKVTGDSYPNSDKLLQVSLPYTLKGGVQRIANMLNSVKAEQSQLNATSNAANRTKVSDSKHLKDSAMVVLRLSDNKVVHVSYEGLKKFVDGALYVGATDVAYKDAMSMLKAESKDGASLLMPSMPNVEKSVTSFVDVRDKYNMPEGGSDMAGESRLLLQQYDNLKAKHKDASLLFRTKDGYETYKEDAKRVGDALGLTVGVEGGVDVVSFPVEALDTYLPKLIRAGHRVAICDKIAEAPKAKAKKEAPQAPAAKQKPAKKANVQVARQLEMFGSDGEVLVHTGDLPVLDEGEFSLVERQFNENGYFQFSGGKIESADDVAYILRNLENKAVENAFAVLVTDGKPTVVHVGMGSFTETMVNKLAVRAAVDTYGADKIYFVHNHPSGKLQCSGADRNLYQSLHEMFGDKLEPGIIINTTSGQYALFDEHNGNISEQERATSSVGKEQPIVTKVFDKLVFDKDYDVTQLQVMDDPGKVAAFVSSQRLGERKKVGVLILDNALKMVGNLHLPFPDLSSDVDGLADELVRLATKNGGRAIIPYGNFDLTQSAATAIKSAVEKRTSRGILVMDILANPGSFGYVSARGDLGYIGEEATKYNNSVVREDVSASEAEMQRAMGEVVVDLMRNSGIEVSMDEKEMREVLEANERLQEMKKAALDTASPSNNEGSLTVVSSTAGAKILKNLQTEARRLENLSSTQPKTFIGDLAKVLEMKPTGRISQYGTFETKNGKLVTIRLSNHNSEVADWDDAGVEDGISIIVTPKPNEGLLNNGDAHVTEAYYNSIKLRKAEGKPLADIVRSIEQVLYSGEFKDKTGLAEVQEVNRKDAVQKMTVYHGTTADFEQFDHSHMGEGEGAQSYGWGTYVTSVDGVAKHYASMNDSYKRYDFDMKKAHAEKFVKRYPTFEDFLNAESTRDAMQKHNHSEDDARKYYENKKKVAETSWPGLIYDVEIPDDNGSNYLHYDAKDGHIGKENMDKIAKSMEADGWKIISSDNTQVLLQRESITALRSDFGAKDIQQYLSREGYSANEISNLLHNAGFVGIKYPAEYRSGGREDKAQNYVIFNEADAQITNKTQFLRTSAGDVYGFVKNGKVYLDPTLLNINTPVHEYTHLWDTALQQHNPELWERGVELMKQTPLWEQVKSEEAYAEIADNDNLVASEVHSRLSGAEGERLFKKLAEDAVAEGKDIMDKAEKVSLIHRLKEWVKDVWKWLKDTMTPWTKEEAAEVSLEDFVKMPLRDLAEGKELNIGSAVGMQFGVAKPNARQLREQILAQHPVGQKLNEASRVKDAYGNISQLITILPHQARERHAEIAKKVDEIIAANGFKETAEWADLKKNIGNGELDAEQFFKVGASYNQEGWNVLREVMDNKAEMKELKAFEKALKGKKADELRKMLDNASPSVTQFSIKKPVERKGDLVAIHNLDAESLQKAIDLGGFPMPSIAITKTDIGHENYGDISLVFGKNTINPTDRRNKIYGADAWTPTFPAIVPKFSETVMRNIRTKLRGLLEGAPFERSVPLDEDNMSDRMGRSGDFVNGYKNETAIKYAFLKDKGIPLRPVMKEKVYDSLHGNETLRRIINEVGHGSVKDLPNRGFEEQMALEPEIRKIITDWRKADIENWLALLPPSKRDDPEFIEKFRERKMKTVEEPLTFSEVNSLLYSAATYEREGDRKIVDGSATKQRIDKKFTKKLEKEYEEWLADMSKGIVEKQGIRNNTDCYTPMGNRRKWEALHDPVTLNNVVKNMLEQDPKGGGVFGMNPFGAAAEDITSIEELHDKADTKMKSIDDEEREKLAQGLRDRMTSISIPGVKSDDFSARMSMFDAIFEAYAKDASPAGIYRYVKRWYKGMTMDIAKEIADIVKDMRKLPTRYFESKPRRAVGFEEVKLAIVPKKTDAELVKKLESYGIDVRFYNPKAEGNRLKVLNKGVKDDDLRFRDGEEPNGDSNKYRVIGNEETDLLEFLNNQPTRKGFRYAQWANFGVLPPMTAKQNGEWRAPQIFGRWEQSEELPRNADGKVDLVQGNGRTTAGVAYNPYFHIRVSPLNDQFTAAYDRPELIVVEGEYPESELTSGFKAEGAKDAVGLMDWHSGPVNAQLSNETSVQTMLSRYFKPGRIVPWSEVADNIMERVGDQDITFAVNTVPPMLRAELVKRGAKFGPVSGSVAEADKAMLEDIMIRANKGEWDAGLEKAREYLDAYESSDEAKEARVAHLSEQLGTPIRVIKGDKADLSKRQQRAKGWWSSKTDEVVVMLDNNVNVADVENTAVHEVVGHKGLRALIGEERFGEFLDEVHGHAGATVKKGIDKLEAKLMAAEVDRLTREKEAEEDRPGSRKGVFARAEATVEAEQKREQFRREATEEYMADMAGRIGEQGFKKMSEEELTFWGKVKATVQKFLDKFLAGLKIPKSIKLTEKDVAYILFKSYQNLKNGGKPSVVDMAKDAVMRSKTDYNMKVDEKQMFRDGDMGLDETITSMKAEVASKNADDFTAKTEAMKAIGGNLQKLRSAMAKQRQYDISTAKAMTDLAQTLLDKGMLSNMSAYETKRVLSAIQNGVGKEDLTKSVQKLMDIMVDNQLHAGANMLGQLFAVRGSRVNERGVETIGRLDADGQALMKAAKKYTSFPKSEIDGTLIPDLISRMGSSDQSIADNAAMEYAGVQIARRYVEEITESKLEEKQLRDSIKQAKEDKDAGHIDAASYKQYVQATEDAIRHNKIDRAEAYASIAEELGGRLGESAERAKAWREAEQERINEIHHNCNSDMEGRVSDEHHKEGKAQKFMNNSAVRFLFAPLGTFDQMLRMFGQKNVNGEGYLWNRYIRGWVDAAEGEYLGYRDAVKELDEKVSEVYGKPMTWGQLIREDGKLPKTTVEFWDGGERKMHEVTMGNLLYIYMTDKMADGRMKLRYMGIDDGMVEQITDMLPEEYKTLADWLQDEFLVEKRNKYNEVHKRMFGAPMAAIENYFPLKVLQNALDKNEDVAEDDNAGIVLAGATTGGIIKRVRNNKPLDVTGANAFNVILDHLQEMEHWSNFAELTRDINTMLSYKRFRNQVKNMTSAYGAGSTLWKNFRNAAKVSVGAYRPPIAELDKAAVNVAKGVTAAKVSFRVFTAMKQLLSAPAYLPDANPLYLMQNFANPVGAWKWGMENLPIFEKRWKSRMAGDPRLMKSEMDWKMWRSRVVEIASRIGMSPNAFVDAVTVSIGAHSIYQTKYAKYRKYGFDHDAADKKAKQDATILFNETQQSSEGPFMSTMQVDRSWLSTMFTVFRNSSMAYTRQAFDAARNELRLFTPGYTKRAQEYMAKQLRREGLSDEQAEKAARSELRKGPLRNLARLAVFSFVMQFAWNLGANLPYLLLGDDGEKKDDMVDDALTHAIYGGLEGLTGGDVISNFFNMQHKDDANWQYLVKDMPIVSDMSSILKKWPQDNVEAMNDVVNLLVQAGVGVNPQSLTDAVVAVIDACGDDAQTARECALLIGRIANCPPSQMEKIYFDELGVDGVAASKMTPQQIANRYARYKRRRLTPFTGWMYGEEGVKAKEAKVKERAVTIAKESLEKTTDGSEREALKGWRDEYKAMAEEVKRINKIRNEDEDAADDELDKLEQQPSYERYEIMKDYKKDISELTKEWLNSQTTEERERLAKAMSELKRELVEELKEVK